MARMPEALKSAILSDMDANLSGIPGAKYLPRDVAVDFGWDHAKGKKMWRVGQARFHAIGRDAVIDFTAAALG